MYCRHLKITGVLLLAIVGFTASPAAQAATTTITPLFPSIRTTLYICPQGSAGNPGCENNKQDIADHYDMSLGGINVRPFTLGTNPDYKYLSYQQFTGISIYKTCNVYSDQYQAISYSCAGAPNCIENFFLHLKTDLQLELENRRVGVTEKGIAPGWNPANDVDDNGIVDALDGEEKIICPDAFRVGTTTTTTVSSVTTSICPVTTTTTTIIPAECVSVSPGTGTKGNSYDIIITGDDTTFDNTTRVYFECRGITVNTITVDTTEKLIVNITIAGDALSCVGDVKVISHRVDPEASADTKSQARAPAYYWPDTANNGGNFTLNPALPEYHALLPAYLLAEMVQEDADGVIVDSLRTVMGPSVRDYILDYPFNDPATADAVWKAAVIDLLKAVEPDMQAWGKIVVGNAWYSPYNANPATDEFVIDGRHMENWKDIGSPMSNYLVSTNPNNPEDLTIVKALDDAGKIQVMQFNPIGEDFFAVYDEAAKNREKMFALASYYLYHGNHTYFEYGVDGVYQIGYSFWFPAVTYDIGSPLGVTDYLDKPIPANNLVANNSGFESNLTGWTPSGSTISVDPVLPYEGLNSVKIDVSNTQALISQPVTLQPYTTYNLSAAIKTDGVGSGASGNAATLYLAAGTNIVTGSSSTATYTNDWKIFSKQFTTGSTAIWSVVLKLKDVSVPGYTADGATVWFDNVSLVKVEAGEAFNEVLARDYLNALVLVRPITTTFYSPVQLGDTYTRELGLSKYGKTGLYKQLQVNGTLAAGTPVGTISLRYGEAAILIPATSTSTSVSATTTIISGGGGGGGGGGTPATTTSAAPASTTSTSSATSTIPQGTTTTTLVPGECVNDIDCDDGKFCNGAETCVEGKCVDGTPPCPEGQQCQETSGGYQCWAAVHIAAQNIPVPLSRPLLLDTRKAWLLVTSIEDDHFSSSSEITIAGPDATALGVIVDTARQPFKLKRLLAKGNFIFIPVVIEKQATAGTWSITMTSKDPLASPPLEETITSTFQLT